MANESLILNPNSRQVGSMLGYKPVPQETNPNAVLPVEVSLTRNSVGMEKRSDGLWHQVPVNMPRRYWNGTEYSWLFEPQATNSILYSTDFSNANWVTTAGGGGLIAVTADYSISPDGTLNADRLLITTVTSAAIAQPFVVVNGQTYTISIWAKSNTGSSYTFQLRDGFSSSVSGNLTITPTWQLFQFFFTASGTTAEIQFRTLVAGVSDLSIWNGQAELGSTATSPIITAGSAVTRLADVSNTTGLSAVIGQTEGTIVYKIGSSLIYNATFIELHKNSVQNRIAIYTQPNGNLSFIFRNAGSYSSITNSSTQGLADGTVVLKYSASGAKLFYGGAVIASDDTIVVPETDVLTLGSESSNVLFSGQCKNAIIYETAISDSEAIELTTI
jgi:hypothetical protein